MAFNYLQTDDRDDYFNQFGKSKTRIIKELQIINPSGDVIFTGLPQIAAIFTKRLFSLTARWTKKGRWRLALKEKGYTTKNI